MYVSKPGWYSTVVSQVPLPKSNNELDLPNTEDAMRRDYDFNTQSLPSTEEAMKPMDLGNNNDDLSNNHIDNNITSVTCRVTADDDSKTTVSFVNSVQEEDDGNNRFKIVSTSTSYLD